ncbi:MAG TPA: sigma-70 family RNA polymerase sigma factor [Actinomycetota bacterium]|nr:sigma-70 family RNA polymerase sigma factor [Actinomycetota bacterium]
MDQHDWLAKRFEEHRTHLEAVAYRMLGSRTDADDAVQEAWVRLGRTGGDGIENLGGWLTTVVARVCLDMLRSRESRREDPLEAEPEPRLRLVKEAGDPEHEAVVADSVGLALLVVLDTLTPAERLAFVLHDTFGVPFEEIAPIIGRSPAAARQLASRGRRRVRGARAAGGRSDAASDLARRRAVVDAFLAASRSGEFDALVAVLDPDVVLRMDGAGVMSGGPTVVRGRETIAGQFVGRAKAARPVLVDGAPGLVWMERGRPQVVFAFIVRHDRISEIELIGDPDRIAALELSAIGD